LNELAFGPTPPPGARGTFIVHGSFVSRAVRTRWDSSRPRANAIWLHWWRGLRSCERKARARPGQNQGLTSRRADQGARARLARSRWPPDPCVRPDGCPAGRSRPTRVIPATAGPRRGRVRGAPGLAFRLSRLPVGRSCSPARQRRSLGPRCSCGRGMAGWGSGPAG